LSRSHNLRGERGERKGRGDRSDNRNSPALLSIPLANGKSEKRRKRRRRSHRASGQVSLMVTEEKMTGRGAMAVVFLEENKPPGGPAGLATTGKEKKRGRGKR